MKIKRILRLSHEAAAHAFVVDTILFVHASGPLSPQTNFSITGANPNILRKISPTLLCFVRELRRSTTEEYWQSYH